MKKNGQGPLGISIGLIVIVFLLVIIAWAFKPTTTGQVVAETEETEKINYISAPFELKAWVINSEGVKVDLKNLGDEEYLIKSVEVKGCGTTSSGRGLKVGASQLFSIECKLNAGEKFRGILIVKYSPTGGGVEKSAFGNVEDLV